MHSIRWCPLCRRGRARAVHTTVQPRARRRSACSRAPPLSRLVSLSLSLFALSPLAESESLPLSLCVLGSAGADSVLDGLMKLTLVPAGLCLLFASMAAVLAQDLRSAGVPVVIATPQGRVEGLRDPSTGVESFKGIPYAEPPVGELRFAEAQLKPPWAAGKVQSAHEYGHKCLQTGGDDQLQGAEDCLVLNVWRPQGTDEHSNLPVMFWIHGHSRHDPLWHFHLHRLRRLWWMGCRKLQLLAQRFRVHLPLTG